jgi:hypothetical protein
MAIGGSLNVDNQSEIVLFNLGKLGDEIHPLNLTGSIPSNFDMRRNKTCFGSHSHN